MRRLIYVPTVHTMADMGSRGESLKREFIREFGPELWTRSRQVVEEVWDGIRAKLLALPQRWQDMRIYQDGLPVSGRELDLAREVAAQGSKNYQLVLELVGRGARLVGTESPELLMREYAAIRRITDAPADGVRQEARRRYLAESGSLLKDRDAFIAKRIVATLKRGEVGILFIGLLHEVDRLLPESVEVEYLIDRLPLWVVRSGAYAA